MLKVLLVSLLGSLLLIGCGSEPQVDDHSDHSHGGSTEFVQEEVDNLLFDSTNSSQKAAVLNSIRSEFVEMHPDVLSMTTTFHEYETHIVVDIRWEDNTFVRQTAGQPDEDVFVAGGQWQRIVTNEMLEQIVGG